MVSLLLAACCFGPLTHAAFEKDNTPAAQVDTTLQFSVEKTLQVTLGDSSVFFVNNGTGPYTVVSSDDSVATATVKKHEIKVTGLKEGTVVITVADKNNLTGSLSVTVVAPEPDTPDGNESMVTVK